MLTGGKSIENFYKFLSKKIDDKFIKKTNFYMTDERIFQKEKDTNYHFINHTLFKNFRKNEIKFNKFYDEKKTINENLNFFDKKLKKMDITFLSYGIDNHVASIFPNIKPIISKKKVLFIHNKDNVFQFRISVNKKFINKSKIIFLFFLGKEKKKIFYSLKKKNFKNMIIKNFIPVVI